MHVLARDEASPSRFGVIVTKKVGGAVKRNLARRRLRAVCFDLVPTVTPGIDVVIRALPGSDAADWAILHREISSGIDEGMANL